MNVVERLSRRYCKWTASRFARRVVNVRCERPIVSFSFDDFPRTAATNGGRVLSELGIRATYFIAFGLENTPTSGGPAFTIDDVRRACDEGHELGCHTFGHELSHRVSREQYANSIERNKKRFDELKLNGQWSTFAYPAGSASGGTKQVVQNRFACGRGTTPGINAGETDINLLRANSLYSDQRPAAHHIIQIDEAAAKNGWLIFYTHDVDASPSRFGCTPEYLREIAQTARDRGVDILPIGEAIAKITAS